MEQIQRTAAYVRVSTQEQRLRGYSPDAQRDKLRSYATEHNLKIVEWYEDLGVSGTKPIRKRPELQRMINDAEAGKFDRIIFIKLDRYFRSVAEYYECQKRLDAKNVLWTATEEKFDLTTASGRYWVTQKLAMAEYEASTTGERIALVNEYKIKTGQAITGKQSLGIAFTVKTDDKGVKRVVRDPNTEEHVRAFIEHYLVYHNKGQAHAYVNNKFGTKYGYNAVSRILTDTKIYGHYKGNDNYCEAYIDKATFDFIQEKLVYNVKTPPSKRIYLFTGLIKCPVCGHTLIAKYTSQSSTVNKTGRKYYHGKDHYAYRCNNRIINKMCDFPKYLSEEKLEKQLIENLNEYVRSFIEVIKIEDVRKKDDTAHKKIKDIKAEITRLNNMYQKGRKSEKDYDREYEELEARLRALESALEPQEERDMSVYEELLKSDWKTIYNALTKENKRAFWRKYIKEIRVNKDGSFKEVIFF